MKKIITAIAILIFTTELNAQNVGIGTTEPYNKLHIVGSLLVTTPTTATNTAPAAAQTKTMVNASTISFLAGDSTGRIYDPGGPAGNYNANLIAFADIANASCIGIEITAETIGLGTGDSLIIKKYSFSTDNLLAVGNGYNSTGKWVFNSPNLHIIFKSNADANTGIGFSLLFKRLYNNSASLPEVSGATGNALLFDTKNGYFRSGLTNSTARGNYSTAMGHSTNASKYASTAMGDNTVASGNSSTAMGDNSIASGDFSTAMGYNTNAGGNSSTAMGYLTNANGNNSTAMGYLTTASGDNSTAMGNYVSTNNQDGSFVIGDHSATTVLNSANANNFRARFAGGYKLYTSANLSTGCTLFAGDNAWTTGSDVGTKENFAEVNGEDLLKKIASFHLTTWNYKTQDPKTFRHYGPMAQDFYAAFGKDSYGTIGNETGINSADFAGVSFIAIQALEKRTQQIEHLQKENTLQAARLQDIEMNLRQQQAIIENLQKQTNELKALLNTLTQGNK